MVAVLLIMSWWVLIKNTVSRRLAMEDRQLAYEGMAVLAVASTRMVFGSEFSMHPPCYFFVALGAAEVLRRKLKREEGWEPLPQRVAVGA